MLNLKFGTAFAQPKSALSIERAACWLSDNVHLYMRIEYIKNLLNGKLSIRLLFLFFLSILYLLMIIANKKYN